MKKYTIFKHGKTALFALLLVSVAVLGAEKYKVDPVHSYVGFSVKHLVISTTKGQFGEFSGTITIDEKAKKVIGAEGVVKTASINTGNDKRDEHLRAPDFFDVKKFPEIKFNTTKITKSQSEYLAEGNFTMRGVTKKVQIPFTFQGPITNPWGKKVIAGDAAFTINRQDYGVSFSKKMDSGGLVVGDKVKIEIHVEAIGE